MLRSVEALLGQDHEVASAFLMASVYVVSVNRRESPRDVCEALFKALPSSEAWPSLRDAMLEAATGGD